MNQYSLRLGQMEYNYKKSQLDEQVKFYNYYTPILMVCLITFIMNAQDDIAFNYLLSFSIFLAIQYFYVVKCRPVHVNICMVINNILFSSTLMFIDNGWVISLITIQLSCHPDFMWNTFQQFTAITIQTIGSSLSRGFQMITVNVILLLLFQIYINKHIIQTQRLYYQQSTQNSFNEKLIDYIDEIVIHFYFNSTTFQFEMKKYNKQADLLLNLKDRNNFKDFLKTTTLNQNQLMSLSVKENQNLNVFLYDNYIKNMSYFGTTEMEIKVKPNNDIYQLICYSEDLISKEFIFILKREKQFQQLDLEIKKQKEIKIFKSQLEKIVDRTYKQVQSLQIYHEQYKAYPVVHMNYKDLYLQIISNTKNMLIIQGLLLFSMTKSQQNQIEQFDVRSTISKCVELAHPLAIYNYKGIECSVELKNDYVKSISWMLEFAIISILYSLLSQEEITDLEILVKPYQENTILFNINIYGAQEIGFIKYFTFLKQQIYKAINIIGPKSEITLIQDPYQNCINY